MQTACTMQTPRSSGAAIRRMGGRSPTALAVSLAAAACVWQRSHATTVGDDCTFDVDVGGVSWFVGGVGQVHVEGQWHAPGPTPHQNHTLTAIRRLLAALETDDERAMGRRRPRGRVHCNAVRVDRGECGGRHNSDCVCRSQCNGEDRSLNPLHACVLTPRTHKAPY
jgi:hypothetical protein